jgi:hypothetical protein
MRGFDAEQALVLRPPLEVRHRDAHVVDLDELIVTAARRRAAERGHARIVGA